MSIQKAPQQELCKTLNCSSVSCIPLTEDGSNRQYFRIAPNNTSKTFILMQVHGQDAMDLSTGQYSWLRIAELLKTHKVLVPGNIQILSEYDSILIEDFGDQCLDNYVKSASKEQVEKRYTQVGENLCRLLNIPPDYQSTWSRRGFDYYLLKKELDFFKDQYLSNSPSLRKFEKAGLLTEELSALAEDISKIPQHFTHRDFHSRNLLVYENQIGIIDFQDARWGPAAYDLCSLCFDPYVNFDFETRETLFSRILNQISQRLGNSIPQEIQENWRNVCLQRLLKAIGSFAFLTKKGKRDYTQYIRPTLEILEKTQSQNTTWAFIIHELLPEMVSYEKKR